VTSGFTSLDMMVLLSMGVAAAFGGVRGFVIEAFTLAAWVGAVVAVRFFQAPVAAMLEAPVGTAGGATLLAFVLVFGATFIVIRLAGSQIGGHMKASVLGPIDRVLGAGFGMLKGLIIATLAFLLMSLVHDLLAGAKSPRPAWMTESRTYQLLRASSAALLDAVEASRTR